MLIDGVELWSTVMAVSKRRQVKTPSPPVYQHTAHLFTPVTPLVNESHCSKLLRLFIRHYHKPYRPPPRTSSSRLLVDCVAETTPHAPHSYEPQLYSPNVPRGQDYYSSTLQTASTKALKALASSLPPPDPLLLLQERWEHFDSLLSCSC